MPRLVRHPNGSLYKLPINGQQRIAMVRGPQYANKIMKVSKSESHFCTFGMRCVLQSNQDTTTMVNTVRNLSSASTVGHWNPGVKKTFLFQGMQYAPSLENNTRSEYWITATAHRFRLRYVPYTISSARLMLRAPAWLARNNAYMPLPINSKVGGLASEGNGAGQNLHFYIEGGPLLPPSRYWAAGNQYVDFLSLSRQMPLPSGVQEGGINVNGQVFGGWFNCQIYDMFNKKSATGNSQGNYTCYAPPNNLAQNWLAVNIPPSLIANMTGRDYVWVYLGFGFANFIWIGGAAPLQAYTGLSLSVQDVHLELTLNGGPFA